MTDKNVRPTKGQKDVCRLRVFVFIDYTFTMAKKKEKGRIVKVGITQMTCAEDPAVNRKKQAKLIEQAAKQGAQIICTQEMFASQYFCQVEDHRFFKLAETIPGPSTELFGKIAKKHKCVIIASLFEKRAAGLYHNTAVVIETDGSILGIYRKMHIPDDPLYYEKFYFTPGDLGFRSFATRFGQVGACVCWDQWFPEAARLTALAGAEILFYPTAIGWLPEEKAEFGASQHSAWETMMRSHAIANGVFVCAPNRVGVEGKLQFWGASFVCDPYGNVLARASHDAEETLLVELDLSRIDVVRTHWPFLRDRRIDAYGPMTKRFLGSD
jgi:N-carbamoylputrescine amidase